VTWCIHGVLGRALPRLGLPPPGAALAGSPPDLEREWWEP